MVEGLEYGENEKYEQARARFDNSLGVSRWQTPGMPVRPQKERPAGAPDWWVDDEEASGSFLASQGVVL